jgi:GxxExxY protein
MASTLPDHRSMFTDSASQEGLTSRIIRCAIAVHTVFGAGLLESVYKACLVFELSTAGLKINRECSIPLVYKGQVLGDVFRPDFVVADTVVVEVKAVSMLTPVHTAQLITYLKLTGCPVGLLINLNTPLVTKGIRRVDHPDLYQRRKGGE